MTNAKEIVLFETEDKKISLNMPVEEETIWLTQSQMVELFQRDVSVISRHIRNIFKEEELEEKSNLGRKSSYFDEIYIGPFFVCTENWTDDKYNVSYKTCSNENVKR